MTFSDKELEKIEQLASLYMPISDIAVILGCNPEMLRAEIACKQSPAYTSYRRGKLATKIEIRSQEAMQAKKGSLPALEIMQEALLDMEDDE